ncbi:MAG TPA: N-acetyl sugar amidotransferase [Thermoanaerobaculia bacterium]|nr:N-acetyl sugar amidotransferase [Thermoanaerobaculia bacterium]
MPFSIDPDVVLNALPSNRRICTRCVMDTSDPEIVFDEEGNCNHCTRALMLLETRLPLYKDGPYRLDRLVERIQINGKGRPYDCIVGVSGGADSTFAAYTAKKLGLRPLAVHFDNGWNSELAVSNIEQTLRRMGIELYTYVVDWEEFRDLQLSFLRASVPDAEIPTDHGIWALLYKTAKRFGVRHIVTGTNLSTESVLPRSWTYGVTDWTYIKDVHRRFGNRRLKTFPRYTLGQFMFAVLVRRVTGSSILNSVEYNKEDALQLMERELGYRRYPDKHHESIYTRFFQSYILPRKFGIDKRRAHLSSLIMSDQITRETAVDELQRPVADEASVQDDLRYVVKKFGITEGEFAAIMALPRRSYRDYRNQLARQEQLKVAMRLAQRYHIVPRQLGL